MYYYSRVIAVHGPARLLWAALAIASVPGGLAAAPRSAALHAFQGDGGAAYAETLVPGQDGGGVLQPVRQAYTFREIDFAKHRPTELWDLNGSGTAVGDFAKDRRNTPGHCFLLAHNARTRIDHPGSSETRCQGINRHGAVVGEYKVHETALSRGFVYADGVFRTVSPPEAFNTSVNAINDAGVMVGTCFDPDGGHGFLYDGHQYWLIDAPHALVTSAEGINNKGEIVADAVLEDDHYHAYLIRGKRFTEVRFPHARDNQGWQINDRGEVGFGWTDKAGTQHGGVYNSARGAYQVVDVPGKASTTILGIDEAGRLAGMFQDRPSQDDHGFIAMEDFFAKREGPLATFVQVKP